MSNGKTDILIQQHQDNNQLLNIASENANMNMLIQQQQHQHQHQQQQQQQQQLNSRTTSSFISNNMINENVNPGGNLIGNNVNMLTSNKETLEEKKRKLTLALPLVNTSQSSESSSITSCDSSSNLINGLINNALNNEIVNSMNNNNSSTNGLNKQHQPQNLVLIPNGKKHKALYTQDGLVNLPANLNHAISVTETPSLNKDLVNHLDINNNLTTPQLEKLLADFNSNGMRTPGSALALLTPNSTLSATPSNTNLNNTNNGFTIGNNNNNNNNSNIQTPLVFLQTLSTPIDDPNFISLQNVLFNSNNNTSAVNNQNTNIVDNTNTNNSNNNNHNNNPHQYPFSTNESLAITPSTLINPNSIFGVANTNNLINNSNETNTNNSNNTGSSYYVLQQPMINNNDNSNNLNPSISNSLNNINNGLLITDPNQKLIKVKDELQTVPVHAALINQKGNKAGAKRKANNDNSKSKVLIGASGATTIKMSDSEQLKDISGLGHTSDGIMLSSRRDTDNSTASSSNQDSFSPINLESQETLKLEKKRERNREAARKCRTRKLEKIANLEIQVKNLTESNEIEKAKTRALKEEINKIKQKLETHQKLHNCDLKLSI